VIVRSAVYALGLATGALAGAAWWSVGASADVVGLATVVNTGLGVSLGLHFEGRVRDAVAAVSVGVPWRTLGIASASGVLAQAALGGVARATFGGDPRVEAALGLPLALVVVYLMPVLEEAVFRGVLWDSIRARVGDLGAHLWTSALFAVAHLPDVASRLPGAYAPIALVLYFLAGGLFGALRRAEGLHAAVACHVSFNAAAVLPALLAS
jgi:membrane protease YdiL (CAAX protease family)